jgi:peroxiredoxin
LIDPAGKIARAFMSVNPMRHSAEMLAAIDEAVQVSGFKQPASGP